MQLVYAVFEFAVFLFSVSCHECAHAWMASRLGDQTARLQGRITLNPLNHIDPVGTLLFPAIMLFAPLFMFGGGGLALGWGKPTPVMTRNFRNITRDINLSTAAGLAAHLVLVLLALVFLVVLNRVLPEDGFQGDLANEIFLNSAPQALIMLAVLAIKVNVTLFLFNLLPIPPLDGGRILRNLLPYSALETFDQISRFSAVVSCIVGAFWVNLLLDPALRVVFAILNRFT